MTTKKTLARRINKLEVKAKAWDGRDFSNFADELREKISDANLMASDLARLVKHFDALNDQVHSFGRELDTSGKPPPRWHKDTIKNITSKLPGVSKKVLAAAKKLAADTKKVRDDGYRFRKLFEDATLG